MIAITMIAYALQVKYCTKYLKIRTKIIKLQVRKARIYNEKTKYEYNRIKQLNNNNFINNDLNYLCIYKYHHCVYEPSSRSQYSIYLLCKEDLFESNIHVFFSCRYLNYYIIIFDIMHELLYNTLIFILLLAK